MLLKEKEKNRTLFKHKLKVVEGNLITQDKVKSYNICKSELNLTYHHISESIRLQSKCD